MAKATGDSSSSDGAIFLMLVELLVVCLLSGINKNSTSIIFFIRTIKLLSSWLLIHTKYMYELHKNIQRVN